MLETMKPQRGQINAGYLHPILSGVSKAGYDVDKILRRAGIDVSDLHQDDQQLSQPAFTRLVRTLTRMTGDEFWLICGRPIKIGTFATMCRLTAREKTLGAALRVGLSFYRREVDDFSLRIANDGDEATIWVTTDVSDPERRRVILGATMFMTYGMMCWLIGRPVSLHSVHYSFEAQQFSSGLYSFYDAPLFFNQARDEIRFGRELLDTPLVLFENRLARFIAEMPGPLLARFRDDNSFPSRVRTILRYNLGRPISLEEMSKMLAVSPQTLRRRLLENEGLGFQELKDQVRRDVATRLLRTTRISVEDIALHVGFSELSTFHRAFRRWTGQTPGHYRRLKAVVSNGVQHVGLPKINVRPEMPGILA